MKKKLKELIESASPYKDELLDGLLIADSGELYNGFYEKNGYNNLIVLGCKYERDNPTKYYLLTKISDVVDVYKIESCHLDIKHDLGCIGIWFFKSVRATSILSSCDLEGVEIEKKGEEK